MEISQEELHNWKVDPTTKKLFVRVVSVCEDIKELMVNGMEPIDYHYNRGFVAGLRFLFQIEGDDAK